MNPARLLPRLLLVLLIVGLLGFFTGKAYALERDYQVPWCKAHDGTLEYVLDDRTRVDCLTATHAVEVDFAPKWAEAIGQSLYYSAKTGRRAGILLILRSTDDERFLVRIKEAIRMQCLPIDVWTVQ